MTVYDDEILGKAYDGRLVRRLLGFVWPYKWELTLAILLMVGSVTGGTRAPISDSHLPLMVPLPKATLLGYGLFFICMW